ncbi:MAG: hypothetical protein COA44_03570 [Arcobacter sp.]|nr:MAG: hypothetical protein COA44_03570 [Arcobacter sp.]
MKIVVTGSSGFLAQYFKIFSTYKAEDITFLTTSTVVDSQLLCSPLYENIETVLAGQDIDVIIHFAAVIPTSFINSNYKLFLENNEMMNNLYEFSIKNNLKKFIYLSSFGSMLNPVKLDVKDFYTMSKITGEHFCSLLEAKNIQTASLRISAPYGEYSNARTVLNIFIEKAMNNEVIEVFGTGKREQNFTYAGDIINAIELLLEHKVSGVYNIVSKENTNMLDLASVIIKLTKSSSEIVSGNNTDIQENYAPEYDYIRAKEAFNYEPMYSIERGLNRYIQWLKQ